jgi:methyl-accepting chemotaxis protein
MKLRTRIASVFAFLGVMVLAIAALSGWQITVLGSELTALTQLIDVKSSLTEWQGHTSVNAARTVAALQSADAGLGDRLAPAMKETSAKISTLQKGIEELSLDDEERRLFAAVGESRKAYIAFRDEAFKLKKSDADAAAKVFESKFTPALKAYEASVAAFIGHYSKQRLEERAAARAASERMLTIVAALSGLFLVLATVIAWALTRSITRPMNQAVELANKVAAGDLSSSIQVRSKDEIGQLMAALQRMNDSLSTIVRDVRSGTQAISTASREIASGNADLSQRTEEQASSLEETASSMEELTSTVKQSADNARQANQLASGASQIAVKGGEVVGQVVSTMSGISESSKKIADIIGVIDGIAFQTNILALNAAVEAARAGEQGRGFAVVASEVRTLAQRSAAAAKEIKELITDSVHKVQGGTQLVNQAGKTMEEVVAAVKRVTDIMAEITAAAQEQSSGIEQVNQAVMQMDQVTQQNAALVEEAAAAADSMQQQAHSLAQAVAVFKLEHAAEAVESAVSQKEPSADSATRTPAVTERRGPNRAKNVTRLAKKDSPMPQDVASERKKTGTDDEWSEF